MNFDLFEAIILVGINGFSVFLVVVILANSSKERIYQWFVALTICLVGWVNFAYLGYVEENAEIALSAYRINLGFVSTFFFTAYMFYIESFLRLKQTLLKLTLLGAVAIFIALSLLTDTIIKGVTQREWGNEIQFGEFYTYFSIFAALTTLMFLYYFVSRYSTLAPREKRKVKFFLIGTTFFILFNFTFNILITTLLDTAEYQHFGDYSAIIFLGFTTFAMLKRKFLNVRVALAAFLISAMSVLLLIDIIVLSSNLEEQGVKVLLFIPFVAISVVLVKSVLNEIKQKEEISKINRALKKSEKRFSDLATEQKDIIDVMGHEIRTPLSIIKQELNYHIQATVPEKNKWQMGAVSKKQVNTLFDTLITINEELDHTLRLVTDMLETARIDKERFDLNLSKFDIIDLARMVYNRFSKSEDASDFNLEFKASLSSKLQVEADKTRIRECMDILLSNALKYGKNIHGKKSEIKLEIEKEGKRVKIIVSDNGRGIDKTDIKKLGKKFLRLNPRTVNLERPGGTGLGLFVAKNIIQYHKGELIVTSDGIGMGSKFTISIPIKQS